MPLAGALLTALVPLALSVGGPGSGFEAVGSSRGVEVYRRPHSAVVELAAEGVVNAPPEQVRALLLAYARHPALFKNVAVSRVLARGPGSLVVYQRLRLPVISDRDYALRVTWGRDGDATWIRYASDGSVGPPRERGVVRVTVHQGSWRLEPIHGGAATRLVHHTRIDLAGSVPRALVAPGAAKELPALFQAIRSGVCRATDTGAC